MSKRWALGIAWEPTWPVRMRCQPRRLRREQTGSAMLWASLVALAGMAVLFAACSRGDFRGTAWGDGSFESNGERIYFSATSERGGSIDYRGGPDSGAMMVSGDLACASCHGIDARGGTHQMHMESMDAPNIRWAALTLDVDHDEGREESGYAVSDFRSAVVDGVHGDGEQLSSDMPRWEMSDADLTDLIDYLQSLDGP